MVGNSLVSVGPVIILGPSLSLGEARRILKADYRPPLKAGDPDALPAGSLVDIIDGILEPAFRLPPDEILAACARNIRLFRAASTGARRRAFETTRRMTRGCCSGIWPPANVPVVLDARTQVARTGSKRRDPAGRSGRSMPCSGTAAPVIGPGERSRICGFATPAEP